MSIDRKSLQIVQGNGNTLFKTVIKTDECEPKSPRASLLIKELFETITYSQTLLNCGDHNFESLTIKHNGDRWVLEATFLKIK